MRITAVLFLLILLAGCTKEDGQTAKAPAVPSGARLQDFDPGKIARGAALFEQHCAQCHGPQAQGHPDWQTPSDGTFTAAPPLDGSGNEHKRSKQQLVAVIKNGARKNGVDVMPAWKGRLRDDDVEAVIQWFQSLWPPEVYVAWQQANAVTTSKP